MKKPKNIVSVTLITFDAPIAADDALLAKLNLEPDGWKLVTSKEINSFLKAFRKSFRADLEDYLTKNKKAIRLGGSVFTTMTKVLELRPSIEKGAAFVPVGKTINKGGQVNSLVRAVNKSRLELISKLTTALGGRAVVTDTPSAGELPRSFFLSIRKKEGVWF